MKTVRSIRVFAYDLSSENREIINQWKGLAKQAGYQPAELARLTGVSVRTLERNFQKYLQTTPKTWLTQLMYEEVWELLVKGCPMKSIALEVGFTDVSNFCRAFRRYHGYPSTKVVARAGAEVVSRNDHTLSRNDHI